MISRRDENKLIKKLVIGIMFLSGFFFMKASIAYDGWSEGVINKIRYQPSRILVNQANATNPGSCTNTDYLYLQQGDTTYLKNFNAALLSAYAAGKTVSLALNGCSSGGTSGYPVISEVWVH